MSRIYSLSNKFKKALVTGGAGFVGSNLVNSLLQDNLEVIVIDDFSTGKVENLQDLQIQYLDKLKVIKADIVNKEKIAHYFEGVDVVFHQACSKMTLCLLNPGRDLAVNAQGTLNLLELAVDFKVKKFIHVSTGSVYGQPKYYPTDENHFLNPSSYYGVSKLAGEKYARVFSELYDLDVSILRYYHVYGPKQDSGNYGGVIGIFCEKVLQDKDITIFGDGTQIRSFTYVKDVVNINKFIALKGVKGEAYNCASCLQISIKDTAKLIIQALNSSSKIIYDNWKAGDIKYFNPSNDKLIKLGFEFEYLDFKKGLLETIEWYRKRESAYV